LTTNEKKFLSALTSTLKRLTSTTENMRAQILDQTRQSSSNAADALGVTVKGRQDKRDEPHCDGSTILSNRGEEVDHAYRLIEISLPEVSSQI